MQHAEENDCGMSGCLWRERSEREGEEHDELQKTDILDFKHFHCNSCHCGGVLWDQPKEKEADNEKTTPAANSEMETDSTGTQAGSTSTAISKKL